jgi:hypothetical protein
MSALEPHHLVLLQNNLTERYLARLPQLLKKDKPAGEMEKKNLSRAFSAFALHHITGVPESEAAQAVVDDFEDVGVDAIYYYPPTETVYLVQSKLKASEQFSLPEALAFCQGVRKLLQQDFTGFNQHVERRQQEILNALEDCSAIQLVVAHVGSGISNHAKTAVQELLSDESHGEERLKAPVVDFDAAKVVAGLQSSQAYKRVDTRVSIEKCGHVTEPKTTYFGLVKLNDLVELHKKHGRSLYEKNIRTFLGHNTEVNSSIQKTLAEKPEHFVYLNNGVTALCETIEPKANNRGTKRLDIEGFSVVNGAQTIASSAQFVGDNPKSDIGSAKVSLTLIQADADSDFGKSVTRARNHQNPVLFSNFVALHEEQERLRRDLAHLRIHYAFKAGVPDGNEIDRFRADEAAHALALFHPDPRYVVWLKNEAPSLLDTSSQRYTGLFNPQLTAFQLANAVRFTRFVVARMNIESIGYGREKLTYKHGAFAFGWLLAKQVRNERDTAKLFDPAKLASQLSAAVDQLRQKLWAKTQPMLGSKSPLAFFRAQDRTVPLLSTVMIDHYGLLADPAVAAKQWKQNYKDPYPVELFNYLLSKAPQISGLS